MIEALLDFVAGLGSGLLHVAVFAMAFGETALFVGLVMPGETGMIVAGAAASRTDTSVVTLATLAAVGATLGDSVSYWIGRRWGMSAIRTWEPVRTRLEPRVGRAEGFFERHGPLAVVLGRWPAALRSLVPAVAGMSGMPYRRFLPWNAISSVLWGGGTVTGGYYLGRQIGEVADWVSWALVGAVVAGVATWVVLRRVRRRLGSGGGGRSERAVYH